MKTLVRCSRLYPGLGDKVLADHTIVVAGNRIEAVLPTAEAPAAKGDHVLDHSGRFVMPGLIDVHTHLAYGNAKTEEDIDLYSSLEFRALRGAFFARRVLNAGVTSICMPGGSGRVGTAIRDAIDTGMFDGPRVATAGPYLTTRQGLTDWYPTWIGVPETAIGVLVRSKDEAIETIRRQVKDGVDLVKIALDGIQKRPDGEFIAAFTQEETSAMADEIRRLGKRSVAHARGREASLYAARAGIDLIFHCSYMDDEGLEIAARNGCAISPSLTLLRNTIDFVQPSDPYFKKGRPEVYEREFQTAVKVLRKAYAAGIPMPTGTDTGFAVTPYGEWHARELEIYVQHLGMTPLQALECATGVAARQLAPARRVGLLEPGCFADFLVVDGDPSTDVSVLLQKDRLEAVYLGGRRIELLERSYDPRRVSDFAMTMFADIYTRDRVAELASRSPKQEQGAQS